ncbi:MAG: methyl-accepting chemotaxis protein [Firmicutes bacterium]|nr:methyl-accepting chemotaxis protein [Bacillota bacterium]
MSHEIGFNKQNELHTNALVLKILWLIYVVGNTLIAAMIAAGILQTDWAGLVRMMLGMGIPLGMATILQRICAERVFIKYVLVICSIVSFAAIISSNVINLSLAPLWLAPLAISALYFNFALTVATAVMISFLNAVYIFSSPGRGMELVDGSVLAANTLAMVIAAAAVSFCSYKGSTLLAKSRTMEEASRKQAEIMTKIVSEAGSVTGRVSRIAESLLALAEEMCASLQEVSATTNEFSANSQSMSKFAQQMSTAGLRIQSKASDGSEAVANTTRQIERISESVAGLRDVIGSLHQHAQDISSITNTIIVIAQQTNLIALNAAIEAARAGEHGRGFAVVAEEVRRLAEHSAISATEISQFIQSIEQQTQIAIEAMSNSTDAVESGRSVVMETGKTLASIVEEITAVSGQIASLAASAQNIGAGSEELSTLVGEQTASMEEVTKAASDLQETVDSLLLVLDQQAKDSS